MKINSKLIIKQNSKIATALKKIENNEQGALIVIDNNNIVIGTLTDGDIRRCLIDGFKTSDLVIQAVNKNFIYATSKTTRDFILKALDMNKRLIPLIDNKKRLLDIYSKNNFIIDKKTKFTIHSRAPGRISFSGGGSDMTQYLFENKTAVLNATINMYSNCILNIRDDKKIIIYSFNLNKIISFKDINKFLNADDEFNLIRAAIKIIEPDFGFELNLFSDFNIGSGLAGSTALLASIFGCFNDLRDYQWSKYELSELCFQAERIVFKQKGGWQDQYATVFGGFNFIELSKQKNIVNQLKIPKQMRDQLETYISLVDTKRVHNSGNIHKSNFRKPSEKLNKDIANLYSNAYEMKDYLSKMDFINFNDQINKNWLFKKTISNKVSLKKIDNIIKEGLKNGALSSKLLGSGQGGFIFFIINPSKIKQFSDWIKKNKFNHIKIKFDDFGLSVWRSNEKSILY